MDRKASEERSFLCVAVRLLFLTSFFARVCFWILQTSKKKGGMREKEREGLRTGELIYREGERADLV